ncbi:hypothetical protein [Labilithrix luteola]|uniref:hypothetical protein n=1 Tax=Labilithrix luteola TaxID=1391654 RepID=UPI0011BA9CF4|nr:hypothetical protein [Labilithrix luteola]
MARGSEGPATADVEPDVESRARANSGGHPDGRLRSGRHEDVERGRFAGTRGLRASGRRPVPKRGRRTLGWSDERRAVERGGGRRLDGFIGLEQALERHGDRDGHETDALATVAWDVVERAVPCEPAVAVDLDRHVVAAVLTLLALADVEPEAPVTRLWGPQAFELERDGRRL